MPLFKTRALALLNNESHYFTGKPCKNGHISNRNTRSSHCLECANIRVNKYIKNNPSKNRAKQAARRTREENARPRWFQRRAIQKLYDECPADYHIDHILPIKNDNICGLHVLANLNPLSAKENLRKSNNFHPYKIDAQGNVELVEPLIQ